MEVETETRTRTTVKVKQRGGMLYADATLDSDGVVKSWSVGDGINMYVSLVGPTVMHGILDALIQEIEIARAQILEEVPNE